MFVEETHVRTPYPTLLFYPRPTTQSQMTWLKVAEKLYKLIRKQTQLNKSQPDFILKSGCDL